MTMRKSKRSLWPAMAVALGLVAMLGSWALAVVNPGFTPKNLEAQSSLIFTAKVAAVDADRKGATLTVGEVLKGKLTAAKVRVDLKPILAGKDGQFQADTFLDILKSAGGRPGVFLAGKSKPGDKLLAYLHLEGQWMRLRQGQGADTWALETVGPQQGTYTMNATFNGGSDMLIETLRFIRRFPAARIMRVEPGATWADHAKLGSLPGKAAALIAADANADGRLDLFAACPQGDRIFIQNQGGKFAKDAVDPGSKSLAGAWADFDGDGRPDLASLSNEGLRVWLQTEPGKFTARDVKLPAKVETASPTLAILDLEPDSRPDLAAGIGWPVVLRNDGKANFTAAALPGARPAAERGPAGPCIVADFDADGMPDLIQTFQKSGLLWRGKPGGFHAPAECGARAGEVPWRRAYLTDLEGDGLLDVFLIGGGGTPHLLQNQGGKRFREVFSFCGEPNYKIQTDASCAAFGDFNNDTFVDLFVGGEDEPRLFFFNRGFRSLAVDERQALKIDEEKMPGIDEGVVAAVWADLGDTGAQMLALALPNGDVYLSRTDLAVQPSVSALRVPVEETVKSAAPQQVRFYLDGRCVGVRVADRWRGPAVLGVESEATYTVVFKTPEGKEITREMDTDAEVSSAGPRKDGGQPEGPAPPAEKPPAEVSLLVPVLAGAAGLGLLLVIVAVVARKKRGAGS